ncbi:MAG: glutathione S-transferase [Rhodobacteraceae bacterium]|nr:glutathione S-transferase [Alphaproteobacteria bacterium]NNF71839.1 glutathione S-transferase [Paracoccaceae bacterium]NNK68556.1 glutathione S-transferase [Paracoccaceae bacterium]
MSPPILWSFRRCPYAMRARLAIHVAGIAIDHREILLRDKPALFVETSPKATVPVMVDQGRVIEESLDVMLWALDQNDPEGWLEMPGFGFDLIAENDGPFKTALDRYKYHTRHADADIEAERQKAGLFLHKLNRMLEGRPYLFGDAPRLADMAILPFLRQFANTDRAWFDDQPWPDLRDWLDRFLASPRFAAIMAKHPLWSDRP